MKETMTQSNVYASEIPEFPDEVTLTQAIGLIPKIAPLATDAAMKARLQIDDPVIRVFALETLIRRNADFDYDTLKMALHVAPKSAHLRQLLISELLQLFRFDLIDKVIKLEYEAASKTFVRRSELMRCEHNADFARQAKLHELLYLDTGNILHLEKAVELARLRLTWKQGAIHIVRSVFVQSEQSLEPTVLSLLQCLERNGAKGEFLSILPIIQKLDSCPIARAYGTSLRYIWNKKYHECLEFLKKSNVLDVTRDHSPLFSNLAAKCYENLGQYTHAARYFDIQNAAQKDARFSPEAFLDSVRERAAIEIPHSVPDKRNNYFIMTGFPRSGTTLLENALNSHPHIATCEETSSLIGSFTPAFLAPIASDPDRRKIMLRLAYHQKLYYQNLDRFVTSSDAKVIIDKTPIISANIKYMEKIFPNKRYIFSIRHPYDVVLSNIKQVYSQNSAMTAFNDITSACVLYDSVMRDWFEVFPDETDRVCYVRYDDLVENFGPTLKRVLSFMSVEWSDEVLNFAEHSQKRAVRTPSYEKVRNGLTIGVQTNWKKYEFLFDSEAKALLDPWVRRFGY